MAKQQQEVLANDAAAPALSKKDAFRKRFKERHADKQIADDDEEGFYSQLNDDYDDMEGRIGKYEEEDRALGDMMTKDPRSAAFLMDMKDGRDPILGLIRRIGKEGVMDLLDDPERQQEFEKAQKEYLDSVAENQKYDEEYKKNISESISMLDEKVQNGELDADELDDAFAFLMQIIHDGVRGVFTPEMIDMAVKAMNHDNDVADAEHVGEVRGRNTKIQEKLRQQAQGDGVPQLAGKNNAPKKPKSMRDMSIFDMASMAQ